MEDECGVCDGDGTSCIASISYGALDGSTLDININVGTDGLAGTQITGGPGT